MTLTYANALLSRALRRRILTIRRFTSAVNTHEAFLQPLSSYPGVTTLSLNRPQRKNAISLQLLKVRALSIYIYY